ncbi:hypothetical protein BH24ACT23_BH24ACT23_01040 [soil metagenome]
MRNWQTRLASGASLATLALALSACGGDGDGAGSTTTDTADLGTSSPCEDVPVPEPKQADLSPPPAKPSAPTLTAVVKTSCGSFSIALDGKANPKTVASFEYLAKEGLFDGTTFHRIVPGFVIQGGDPAGNGTGGPGYSVDEPPSGGTEYTRGVVAMAKTEVEPPGRSGSQFFVVTAADAGLPPQYAVVGEVSEGFDVVQSIEAFGDPAGGEAGEVPGAVVIESVTIAER